MLLSGNQTGILLLDYICSQRIKHHKMPANPVMVKTIVTMDLAERIAADYGVRTVNVLTGFKFIGEQIGLLEKAGKENSSLEFSYKNIRLLPESRAVLVFSDSKNPMDILLGLMCGIKMELMEHT